MAWAIVGSNRTSKADKNFHSFYAKEYFIETATE
jgi:hypothetical protein